MAEQEKDYGQFRLPHGKEGRAVVESMNESHYELTGWGLGFTGFEGVAAILDIGCGGGRTVERLAALAPQAHITGIDHSEDCVRWAAERNRAAVKAGRADILRADVAALPFTSGAFARVFAVETAYFWPDLPRGLAEAARVTQTGGQFILIHEAYATKDAPFASRNAELRTKGMCIPSPEEFAALLRGAGFARVQTHTRPENNWLCCVAGK